MEHFLEKIIAGIEPRFSYSYSAHIFFKNICDHSIPFQRRFAANIEIFIFRTAHFLRLREVEKKFIIINRLTIFWIHVKSNLISIFSVSCQNKIT